jgi:hypothetical protein
MATQQTVAYKTYLKETLVEALRNVFVNHPDPTFRNTKVQLGYSLQRADLANTIVIRYYERFLRSAGVGHREWHNVSDDVNPAYQNLGRSEERLIIGTSYSKVEKVEIYPWMQDFETEPNPLPSPADVPWVSLG